jgi:hypothetical protein
MRCVQLCFIDWLDRAARSSAAGKVIHSHKFFKAGCVGLVPEGRQEVVRLRNIMRWVYVVSSSASQTCRSAGSAFSRQSSAHLTTALSSSSWLQRGRLQTVPQAGQCRQ